MIETHHLRAPLAVASVAAAAALLGAAPQDREADARAIRAHIDSIFQAYIDGDLATIRATHSTDWVGYLSASTELIDGIDAYMARAEETVSRPMRIRDHTITECNIRFQGDLALVPYIASMEVGPEDGEPFSTSLRVLDVYQEREGEWIQIASNVARHPDSEAEFRQYPTPVHDRLREELFAAREDVWRALFSNDAAVLDARLPDELVVVDSDANALQDRAAVLAETAAFATLGGKLERLEFLETDVQVYGDTALFYTLFEWELSLGDQRATERGRCMEAFVRRAGTWVNTGWMLARDDPPQPAGAGD